MKTLARRLVHFFWSSSLRRRLVVGITLTHAVLMSLFIADSYRHQRDFVHAAAKEQALALARALAASSTPWVLANDSEGLAETLSGVRASPDVEAVMVLDPQLRVLAHQDPARVGAWLTDAHSRALLEPRSAAAHLLDTDGPVLDAVAPIVTGAGRTVGWARVRLGQERAAQTLVHLSRVGSLYLLLAIGLGGALAWLLAREVTADLRSLVGFAERVRAGEGTHNEVHRADELGRLATALNETMDTLLSPPASPVEQGSMAPSERRVPQAQQQPGASPEGMHHVPQRGVTGREERRTSVRRVEPRTTEHPPGRAGFYGGQACCRARSGQAAAHAQTVVELS